MYCHIFTNRLFIIQPILKLNATFVTSDVFFMTPTEIFTQFEQLNILIVGDIMIDRYLTGKVDRISPEAPVPVVHLQAEDNRLGGAGNVALNIKAMGAQPYLFSVCGEDKNGQLLQTLLPNAGIAADHILTLPSRITTVKTRVIAQNQHLIRVDREDCSELSNKEAALLFNQISHVLDTTNIHLILFQDYNKGVLSEYLIQKVINEAVKRAIPTAVDPKDQHFWAYKGITFFKPNLREIQQQLEQEIKPTLNDLSKAAQEIKNRLDNKHTMITLSDKGLFIHNEETAQIMPTFERTIADVCGAGDTVISVASLAMALGLPLKEIALLSNLAGGQVCEKVGVVPVNKTQLFEEYSSIRAC